MFIAALFAISKTWKQHRAHQQMNGLRTYSMYVHTHTMECHSAIKKRMKFCHYSNVDGPREYYVKGNKSDKETNTL